MTTTTNPLVQGALTQLKASGFEDAEVIREVHDDKNFGNAEAVFRVDGFFVQFLRDRGQDFVSIAFPTSPEKFFQLDNVEIAMGWKTVEQVIAKHEREDLASVLNRLAQRVGQLRDAFSGDQERFTRARIEKASKDRGIALVARLRR
ncbi:MAG TPA: hypothetical protein VJ860_11080 [Polyangia bacterium]|nr:hypothetical protein [Polyangia bacterium]